MDFCILLAYHEKPNRRPIIIFKIKNALAYLWCLTTLSLNSPSFSASQSISCQGPALPPGGCKRPIDCTALHFLNGPSHLTSIFCHFNLKLCTWPLFFNSEEGEIEKDLFSSSFPRRNFSSASAIDQAKCHM